MTVRINKQKINLREKLAGVEDKVNFDEVVRGLGEYDGNVGIGTTNPGAKLDVNNNTATDNAWNILAKFRPDINDAPAEAGIHIQSYPSSTTVLDRRAGIQSVDDAGNARPLLLNKDGGNVGIGTTNPSGIISASTSLNAFAYIKTGGYGVFTSNSSGPGVYINKTNATTSQATDYINFRNRGIKVGGIEYDGADVVISQSSDVRLKTNIKDSESGLSVINGLQVRSFDWINDSRRSKRFGFVAQEMQEVFEEAVKVGGEDENEDPWGIYDTKLIPILTKAIQEQQQLIDDLKSRIETLEQQ